MRVRGVDGGERELSLVGRRSQPRADAARSAAAWPGLRHLAAARRRRSSARSSTKAAAGERAGCKVGDEILAIRRPADRRLPASWSTASSRTRIARSTLEVRRDGATFATCRSRSARKRVGRPQDRPDRHRAEEPADRYRSHRCEDMLTLQKYGVAGGGRAGRRPRPGTPRCSRCGSSVASSPAMCR